MNDVLKTQWELIPIINDEALENIFDLDQPGETKGSFLKELYEIFKTSIPEPLEKLKNAIQDENLDLIRSLSHKIKGFCRNICLKRFSEILDKIEYLSEKKYFIEKKIIELIDSTYRDSIDAIECILFLKKKENIDQNKNLSKDDKNPLSIAFIEDNEDHFILMSELLKKFFGEETKMFHFETLTSFLNELEQKYSHYDVIICDLFLPDSKGLKTVRKILSYANKTPILITSSLDSEDLAIEAISEGVQDYIVKNTIDGKTIYSKILFSIERKKILNELDDAKMKIAQQAAFKSKFLAQMSHEIRTPMNSVIGLVSVLMRTSLTEDQRSILHTIQKSGEHLIGIINDVLDISKYESGQIKIQKENLFIRNLIEECVSELSVQSKEKRLPIISMVLKDVPINLNLDEKRIKQILINLISNGIKYTQKGFVTIKASFKKSSEKEGILFIDVQDTGKGIPEDKIKQLFLPFMQVHTSDQFKGTGLGLTIAYNLTKLMNGNMTVKSKLNKGSTFSIRIPCEWNNNFNFKEREDFSDKKIILVSHDRKFAQTIKEQYKIRNISSEIITLRELENRKEDIKADLLVIDFDEIKNFTKKTNIFNMSIPILMISRISESLEESDHQKIFPFPLKQSYLFNQTAQILSKRKKNKKQDKKEKKIQFKESQYQGKILVTDDVEGNLKVAERILHILGCQVDLALDGSESIEKCKNNHYDLIFMDCHMPGLSGHETTQAIRNFNNLNRHTPIIALTADAISESRDQCLISGMNDMITKPIKVEDIDHVIKKYIKTK